MKRTVALLLIMLLALTAIATGCGQTASTATTAATTAAPTTTASTTAATTTVKIVAPEGASVEAEKVSDKPLRIAFISFQNNPFWFPIRDGAKAASDYLKNFNCTVDYIVAGEELTSDRVIAAMETAIAKKYDGIVVVPVFDGTEIVIDKAVDAGIPVVCFCAEGSKPSKRLFMYGQNGYAAGQLAGELIAKAADNSGKIGVITGVLGAPMHEQRKNGALDYLKANCPNIEVVGTFENKDKAEVAYNQTKDLLTANPDLKVVYVTAGGPTGAAKAIQDAGLTGKVKVIAYDQIPDNMKYVESGEIVGLIDQDPFGQGFNTNVMLFNYLVNGTKPAGDFVEVKLDVATPEDFK